METVESKVKHTPGPWQTGPLYTKVTNVDETVIVAENPVNANLNDDQFGFEQWRANAKLIAAAPDLLEALQDCWLTLKIQERYALPNDKKPYRESMDKAKAAIQKATE